MKASLEFCPMIIIVDAKENCLPFVSPVGSQDVIKICSWQTTHTGVYTEIFITVKFWKQWNVCNGLTDVYIYREADFQNTVKLSCSSVKIYSCEL